MPQGCRLMLTYKVVYSLSELAGEPWEYSRLEWSALIEAKSIDCVFSPSGTGATPDEAVEKALVDLESKRRKLKSREMAEFREWRAARERKGLSKPFDQRDWDEAVAVTDDDN